MFTIFKKVFLVCILSLSVFVTGAWQNDNLAFAAGQNENAIEIPLYPGLTWNKLGPTTRNITLNMKGDKILLSGETYQATEQFAEKLPQDLLDYYSNSQLAQSGWSSYDAFDASDGAHQVFYHESGVYLSVEFLKCQNEPASTCITVWISEPTKLATVTPANPLDSEHPSPSTSTFGKTSPANGATGVNPSSITFSWSAYIPTPEKYSYCVKEGSDCATNDPNWTSVFTTSVTRTDLSHGKTYHWQVRALTCGVCDPKTWVYADGGSWWTFATNSGSISISGSAGIAGATLSYVDGSAKTVTADSSGNYTISVPNNWTGTVTPSKTGYLFSPTSRSYSNLQSNQTSQNYTAIALYTISGNAGIAGATLSYTDGTAKTVTADGSGYYSITIPSGWTGTVTPSKLGYTFSPVNRTYSNVTTNQTAQDYTATLITYTICGNADLTTAKLSYTDGTYKTVNVDGSGNYCITVPYGWSGTVTPWKSGYGFTPPNRTYTNVLANQAVQNYTSFACSTTDVTIAGALDGSYCLISGQSTRQSYVGLNDGPVKIGTTGTPTILAAQRLLYYGTGTSPTSFVEMMGLPASQLDTTYWFPWYKNDGIVDTQIRIGNVSGSPATVHIYVAGAEVTGSPFTLTASGAGQSQRLSFTLNDGPVKVVSDQNIVATERLIYFNSGVPISFSEMMGLPNSQLSMTYWFPWYKNAGEIDTQLRIGNVSGSTATVHVYIGGVEMAGSPFTLTASGAGQSTRLNFAGINDGPVKIVSDQNIVAAQRILYYANGLPTSFVETMGLPDGQLSTTQWFPWYKNDGIVDTQLRIGNVSGLPASVHIYIGTTEMAGSPFTLTATGAGQSLRLSFTANDGPVKLVSDQNIVTSERLIYFDSGVPVSFSEMVGVPDSLLSATWWLPWYKSVGEIDTQLRFAVP